VNYPFNVRSGTQQYQNQKCLKVNSCERKQQEFLWEKMYSHIMACFGHQLMCHTQASLYSSQKPATKTVNAHLTQGSRVGMGRCSKCNAVEKCPSFRWGGKSKCVYICHANASRQHVQCVWAAEGLRWGWGASALTDSTEGRVIKLTAPTVNSISLSLIHHNRSLILRSLCRSGTDQHVLPHADVNTGIRSDK